MNRKKHFLLILVALVLSFSLTFSLIACDRNTGDPNEGVTDEKALVANGTFAGVESETYPKVPSNWTASAGSTGSQATPSVQGEDVLSGVINVDSKIFKDNANKWKLSKDKNPGKPNNDRKDNNVLMINNLKNTSYRYNSSSISIEKGAYYKVSMNVLTRDNAEAFIYVLGDAFAEFRHIKTDGQWKPFELYIEGADNMNKSIQISLSNGWGDKNGVLSTGAVFFDEIVVEKLVNKDDDKDTAFGKKIYDEQVRLDKSYTNNIATYSMRMPDTEFNYTSGTIQPYTASKYRGYSGYSEGSSNAPSGNQYVSHGVLDTQDPGLSELGLEGVELCPNTLGTKMLFINNKERTAYGYRSSIPFVIKAGKTYNFSVSLKTVGIVGNGATLRLVESSTDSNKVNQISDIKADTWTTYSFTIQGDNLSDKEIFFELWLGEGGVAEESKWTKGTVYMDNIAFGEQIASPVSLADSSTHKDVSYAKDIDVQGNKIDNGYIMGDDKNGWVEKTPNDKNYNFYNDPTKVYHKVLKDNVDGKRIPLPADNLSIKNGASSTILDTALNIHIGTRSAYAMIINNAGTNLSLTKNTYQKYTMWVKTDLDEKYDSQGLNVSLMKKSKKADEDDTAIATFNNINTRKIEKNNGYVELTFYVEGSNTEDNELYLEVMLGSGSRFTADTQVEGDAYITLVGMEYISHEDYVKASTGTYMKKNSLVTSKTSSAKIANGNFTESDINATYDNYTKHQGNLDGHEDEVIDSIIKNGDFIVPTAPTSWSISNKAYLEALTTGIVKSDKQFENITDNAQKNILTNLIKGANDGALVIATKAKATGTGALTVPTSPETCGCTCEECKKAGLCTGNCKGTDGKPCKCLHNMNKGVLPVGYSSSSISLNANSYYMISVKVKAEEGMANVTLNNTKQSDSVTVDSSVSKDWQTVRFYINTGLSSASIKLELYLGTKGSKEAIEGAVAFDNATYIEITEDVYKEAIANKDEYTSSVEFVTDTFNVDNPSEESLSNPTSWSGTVASDGSTKDADLVKGVFDKNYTRSEWLKTTDKDGNDTYLRGDVYDYLIGPSTDNNFLVINNVTPNGYSYSNTNDSKNLAKDTCYKISVKVLTFGLKETENAYVTLKLNNMTYTFDEKVNTSKYVDGAEQLGEWTEYTFYVKTPKETAVNNVTISLGLGKASNDKDNKKANFVQGYAFFDNVTFVKLDTDTEFTDAVEAFNVKKIEAKDADMLKPPAKEEEKTPEKPKNDLLWVYITSGVVGGLTLIVVVAVVLKKYWSKITAFFKKKSTKKMSDYDKNNPNPTGTTPKKKSSKKSNDEFRD